MRIRITENHIFLNEFDIAPFVDRKSIKVKNERVELVLLGELIDERKEKPKPKKGNVEVTNDG